MLLLIPFAAALEITELEFLEFESHGRPIGPVSSGRVPNINLKLVIAGEDFTRLVVDLSGLNRNPAIVARNGYDHMEVQSSTCEKANGIYTCYIRRIELLLPSDTVTMPFTLYNATDSISFDETYIFEIDDTAPEIVSITTDNCIEDTCYMASGETVMQ